MPKLDLQEIQARLDASQPPQNVSSRQGLPPQTDRLEVPIDSPLWDLWRHLSEFYGAAFTSQYGDEPNVTWAVMLKDLTPEQYARGTELLRHRNSAFPPNPGEFLDLIGADNTWERQCHKELPPMLEHKRHLSPEAQSAGREALSELAALLGD